MNNIAGSDVCFVVLHCDNNEAQKTQHSFQKTKNQKKSQNSQK